MNDEAFQVRVHFKEDARPGDIRTAYARDRARLLHSAGFRRLQGKTQVMGVGEGDFHRTRLTHSLEVAQIGRGLVQKLQTLPSAESLQNALPPEELIECACLAHDLGHPPFGHGGEKALHSQIFGCGGFEGNGQTLRILTRLEKYKTKGAGINPTRRLVLAVLKYGIAYSKYSSEIVKIEPPKCYFDSETSIVQNALEPFPNADRDQFSKMQPKGKKPDPQFMTLDASIMEMADDIAFAVHDLEDIVARHLVPEEEIRSAISKSINKSIGEIKAVDPDFSADQVFRGLFHGWSGDRKQAISSLVNLFINSVQLEAIDGFEHPLLAFNAKHPAGIRELLKALRDATYNFVVKRAGVQQLEVRGQRIVAALFEELRKAPEQLIPKASWNDLDETDSIERRVCDYIAGMTDPYAQKIFQRLFTPGFGSSHDEL